MDSYDELDYGDDVNAVAITASIGDEVVTLIDSDLNGYTDAVVTELADGTTLVTSEPGSAHEVTAVYDADDTLIGVEGPNADTGTEPEAPTETGPVPDPREQDVIPLGQPGGPETGTDGL